jgi:hypothetical protein
MRDYGVVESEGTQGYGAARIGLRAPRVAVRVQSGTHWQSGFGLAIWLASGMWGGHGFIYMPHDEGGLHPTLARILTAYDPDYLVDTLWTFGTPRLWSQGGTLAGSGTGPLILTRPGP